jgi:hypothetical protein
MTPDRLLMENRAFGGTSGVSAGSRSHGFLPAFRDTTNGAVKLSCFRDGSLAPMHLLEGLPETWVTRRHPSGRVSLVKDSVIAGFVHQGCFYTREQASRAVM